jgi:hypothetical protein
MKLKRWHKIVLFLVVAGAIAGFFVWRWVNKPNPDYKNKKPDMTVEMSAFLKEMAGGDSAVLNKYMEKKHLVSVKGIVQSVKDGATVNLGDSASQAVVQCQIDPRHTDDIKNVKPGDIVSIKGLVAGFQKQDTGDAISDILGEGTSLGTDIIMNFCILENQ